MGWWRRFFNGLLSKDKSLATGLILGFMAWTLMRLVDGIAANGTIEYVIVNNPATLADGRAGQVIRVTLTNLSADTALTNLKASIAAPTGDIVFSADPKDRSCAFEPPGWGGQPTCDAFASGFDFLAPMIVAGTHVHAQRLAHRQIVQRYGERAAACAHVRKVIFRGMFDDNGIQDRPGIFEVGERQIRAGQKLVDRADSEHAARLQQHDARSQAHNLGGRMRHVDDRQLQLALYILEQRHDVRAARQVETRERLIQEQQLRTAQECARDRHALPLTAGQFVRFALQQGFDAEPTHRTLEADLALGRRNAPEAKLEILAHAEVRKEACVLKYVADRALMRRQPPRPGLPDLIAEAQLAGGITFEPREAAQQGRLSRTGRAEQRGHPVSVEGE